MNIQINEIVAIVFIIGTCIVLVGACAMGYFKK